MRISDWSSDVCSSDLPDETRNRSFQKEWLAVTLSAAIYGFGSAFSDAASSNDIDILILHPSGDVAACRFAIECKARLGQLISSVAVTMLSVTEEIGRGSSREQVCQYVEISGVAGDVKKKKD